VRRRRAAGVGFAMVLFLWVGLVVGDGWMEPCVNAARLKRRGLGCSKNDVNGGGAAVIWYMNI
jgi:hypothetical protein